MYKVFILMYVTICAEYQKRTLQEINPTGFNRLYALLLLLLP